MYIATQFELDLCFLKLGNSTIPHISPCFCPCAFFENIGLNMIPSDSFLSDLYSQLGYSTGVYKALQLIAPGVFGNMY